MILMSNNTRQQQYFLSLEPIALKHLFNASQRFIYNVVVIL